MAAVLQCNDVTGPTCFSPAAQFRRNSSSDAKLAILMALKVQKAELVPSCAPYQQLFSLLCPVSAALLPPVPHLSSSSPSWHSIPTCQRTASYWHDRTSLYPTVPSYSSECHQTLQTEPVHKTCLHRELLPTYLRGQQWVSNVGPLRTATVQHCHS